MSPRKSRRKSSCFSSTTTRTPARASSSPSTIPAGPPPATTHVVRTVDLLNSPPGEFQRPPPPCGCPGACGTGRDASAGGGRGRRRLGGVSETTPAPAFQFDDFDTSVRIQDDLFRHVNGGWAARTEIPDDKPLVGSFVDLRDRAEAAVRDIITSSDGGAPGSDEAKVADLFASFMDTETHRGRRRRPADRAAGRGRRRHHPGGARPAGRRVRAPRRRRPGRRRGRVRPGRPDPLRDVRRAGRPRPARRGVLPGRHLRRDPHRLPGARRRPRWRWPGSRTPRPGPPTSWRWRPTSPPRTGTRSRPATCG